MLPLESSLQISWAPFTVCSSVLHVFFTVWLFWEPLLTITHDYNVSACTLDSIPIITVKEMEAGQMRGLTAVPS